MKCRYSSLASPRHRPGYTWPSSSRPGQVTLAVNELQPGSARELCTPGAHRPAHRGRRLARSLLYGFASGRPEACAAYERRNCFVVAGLAGAPPKHSQTTERQRSTPTAGRGIIWRYPVPGRRQQERTRLAGTGIVSLADPRRRGGRQFPGYQWRATTLLRVGPGTCAEHRLAETHRYLRMAWSMSSRWPRRYPAAKSSLDAFVAILHQARPDIVITGVQVPQATPTTASATLAGRAAPGLRSGAQSICIGAVPHPHLL